MDWSQRSLACEVFGPWKSRSLEGTRVTPSDSDSRKGLRAPGLGPVLWVMALVAWKGNFSVLQYNPAQTGNCNSFLPQLPPTSHRAGLAPPKPAAFSVAVSCH